MFTDDIEKLLEAIPGWKVEAIASDTLYVTVPGFVSATHRIVVTENVDPVSFTCDPMEDA